MGYIVQHLPSDEAPPGREGIHALVGAGAIAVSTMELFIRRVGATSYSVARFALRPPLLPSSLHPERALNYLAERGRRELAARIADTQRLLEKLIPIIVAEVLNRIDVTTLVRERVNLNALVAEVDIDAVAARLDLDAVVHRLDLDAIIDRIDLLALAQEVIDGIDLPAIIRDSSGVMTSEAIRGVRMQGIQADQALAGLVNRLLHRGVAEKLEPGSTSVKSDDVPSTPADHIDGSGKM